MRIIYEMDQSIPSIKKMVILSFHKCTKIIIKRSGYIKQKRGANNLARQFLLLFF